MFKILILLILAAILISLFAGAFFLTKGDSGKQRVATALTIRVVLSITLLILVISGYLLGYIAPHALS